MSLGPGPAWHYSLFLWPVLLNAAFVLRSTMKAFRETPPLFHRPWNEDHNIPEVRQLGATEQSGEQHPLSFVHQDVWKAKSDGGREVQNANKLKQGSFSVSVSWLLVSPHEQVSATATVDMHTRNEKHMDKLMLCLNSFGGESEGQLRHNAVWRLFKFQVSKCTPQILLLFPLFGGCYYPLWPHISQDSLCAWKKKKEREKLATFHGVDRDFCEPGQPKSRRKGKTSGEATRKCSNANNNGWRGSQGLAEGLAFKDRKGWVGQWRRMQTLNWDTTLKVLNGLQFTQQLIWDSVASSGKVSNQLNTPRLTLPETNLIISGTIQNQPAVCPNITKSDWAKLTSYRLPLLIYRTDMRVISVLSS